MREPTDQPAPPRPPGDPTLTAPARPEPDRARRPDDDEVRIGPGVQDADIGGEIVLLDPHDGAYFALNESAAHLWRQLSPHGVARGLAVRRAAAAVTRECRVDEPTAERDLRELLDELVRRRLVAVTPRPAP